MKIVGATGLAGLRAWHIRVENLRCVQGYGIEISNPNSPSLIVSKISVFIFTFFLSLWALKWACQTFFC